MIFLRFGGLSRRPSEIDFLSDQFANRSELGFGRHTGSKILNAGRLTVAPSLLELDAQTVDFQQHSRRDGLDEALIVVIHDRAGQFVNS